MANNLKKFQTESEYSAATLNYPAVSWVTSGDSIHFDKTAPTPPTPTGDTWTHYTNDAELPYGCYISKIRIYNDGDPYNTDSVLSFTNSEGEETLKFWQECTSYGEPSDEFKCEECGGTWHDEDIEYCEGYEEGCGDCEEADTMIGSDFVEGEIVPFNQQGYFEVDNSVLESMDSPYTFPMKFNSSDCTWSIDVVLTGDCDEEE